MALRFHDAATGSPPSFFRSPLPPPPRLLACTPIKPSSNLSNVESTSQVEDAGHFKHMCAHSHPLYEHVTSSGGISRKSAQISWFSQEKSTVRYTLFARNVYFYANMPTYAELVYHHGYHLKSILRRRFRWHATINRRNRFSEDNNHPYTSSVRLNTYVFKYGMVTP